MRSAVPITLCKKRSDPIITPTHSSTYSVQNNGKAAQKENILFRYLLETRNCDIRMEECKKIDTGLEICSELIEIKNSLDLFACGAPKQVYIDSRISLHNNIDNAPVMDDSGRKRH